ncbi:MAG: MFS transporter [Chloroflexi bacterium]|nr:MFS transporter [Chloroflexota bacterium]MBI2979516.1 MFS transporter [Chloroflexota bacterium]
MAKKVSGVILSPISALIQLGRNVAILSACQALGFSGVPLVLLAGGIVGSELAPSPAWATLPIALVTVGIALFTIPASLLMKLIGRKRGFIIAAVVATVAALGAAFAIAIQNFFLFCLMMLFIGGNSAFVMQYRFAATESVERNYTGRAISFVLIGGIIAGFLGPEIGRDAKDWLGYGTYSGSFVIIAILYAVSAILLLFIKDITAKEDNDKRPERPLRTIVTQRTYLVAAFSSAVAFGAMGFIMSATPLSMHVMDLFNLNNTTLVIQSHIIAMYLPSLFTGFLVERLGVKVLQTIGVIAMVSGIIIAVSGHHFVNYLTALTSIGLGWNFLFVAGTVMLTGSYYPKERFKAQGINDFAIFTFQALAVLSAGAVLTAANWELLNLLCLPFLLVMFILILTTHAPMPKRASQ